ncbi:hypothetical protein CDCA_CDCA01G0044 [Cyanidium caldarium]|uniref:G domain-containing protein n=1 Tax=Cyanidium caldarium TaxID=2771 RepID=A0AAV9IPF3_CYACA|nr:hypothetical protein CDCA_CDCA01G0044 [Cyanidium caldarium]
MGFIGSMHWGRAGRAVGWMRSVGASGWGSGAGGFWPGGGRGFAGRPLAGWNGTERRERSEWGDARRQSLGFWLQALSSEAPSHSGDDNGGGRDAADGSDATDTGNDAQRPLEDRAMEEGVGGSEKDLVLEDFSGKTFGEEEEDGRPLEDAAMEDVEEDITMRDLDPDEVTPGDFERALEELRAKQTARAQSGGDGEGDDDDDDEQPQQLVDPEWLEGELDKLEQLGLFDDLGDPEEAAKRMRNRHRTGYFAFDEKSPEAAWDDTLCPGCGTRLQSETPGAAGYVPPEVFSTERPDEGGNNSDEEAKLHRQTVCQRCFQLLHYSRVDDRGRTLMSPQQFRATLQPLRRRPAAVVCLLDIFDFSAKVVKEVVEIAGPKNPVLLAVNKTDALPAYVKPKHIELWVRRQCALAGIRGRLRSVNVISGEKGLGMRGLVESIIMALDDCVTDEVYVMGAANVGKSTLLNRFLGGMQRAPPADARRLTTSFLPGTTLGVLRLPVRDVASGRKLVVVDTPGIVEPNKVNLLALDDVEALKALVPKKRVRGVTMHVSEGKALWLGGLACFELVAGKPWFFTAMVSDRVTVHLGDASKVHDDEYRQRGAVNHTLWPGSARCSFVGVQPREFTLEGSGWAKSVADLVVPGLGWVSVTGSGTCTVRAWVVGGAEVHQREPLLPEEVRESPPQKYFGIPRGVARKRKRAKT